MKSDSSVDLEALGIDQGGDVLLRRALRQVQVGAFVRVLGTHPELQLQLRAWARSNGLELEGICLRRTHRFEALPFEFAGTSGIDGVVEHPPGYWGLAPRGAKVEYGGPDFEFLLNDKVGSWSDDAPRLYARSASQQWNPDTAIEWRAQIDHDEEIEDAVVQIMTYLIENETAALIVPARFLTRIHPHFREVMQVLAVHAAEEARHMEVFTRRALLRRSELALSTTGGQASLKTLVDEPDFALASFFLSVVGEGSFLVLLEFLAKRGPDPITRGICRLAAQDEARHVAFGIAHLRRHAALDQTLLPRLAAGMRSRHAELAATAGLNARVFEALTVLAAGTFEPQSISEGHDAVLQLQLDMNNARCSAMRKLGFEADEAEDLSRLHTRNFM